MADGAFDSKYPSVKAGRNLCGYLIFLRILSTKHLGKGLKSADR
jgi:hypothetical protein